MLTPELQSMRPFVFLELIAVSLHSRAFYCRKYLLNIAVSSNMKEFSSKADED